MALRRAWTIVLAGACLASAPTMRAQERAQTTNELGELRAQGETVAREIVATLNLRPPGRMGVIVEGGTKRILVENALVDELGRLGIRAIPGTADTVLRVVLLEQGLSADSAGAPVIRTTADVRVESANGMDLKGTFRAVTPAGISPEEKNDFLDVALIPLVVIGSVALMVYLFFSVRS